MYSWCSGFCVFFFFQAEDGIRDVAVTGVQTCALPIFQFTVFAESRLPSDDHIPADDTRTGKSDLRGHHRVRANLAVVANVHQVVEFHALRDARVIERTAVNRRVGANFDVIANLHNTNLRELPLPPVSQGVAESVGANHGTDGFGYAL